MYVPKHFSQSDADELGALIRDHPFATLAWSGSDGVDAMHLPLLLCGSDSGQRLLGHVAKANSVWQAVPDGDPVLAIFHGPNQYISPNYYATKQEHGRVVPTWNYAVVHVRGRVYFKHDADEIRTILQALTSQHESDQRKPWGIEDAPEKYTRTLLRAIVGLELQIDSIEGKWKLSQNQPVENRRSVRDALSSKSDTSSAQMIALMPDPE
ncbi:hypothetical protein GCM10008090_15620 [Arenicella chitinivorans]|uniref:FMN-binding negative transcriptional regulator n=1 Tax=Arenicella chitinivorans TaxID=1329800 RepID=A0A918VM04_9GAMM|nr:FMN-binding negative transcriptional regulator [Arenicella chitinivorans]GHA06814.1 hypothetical protein GCM10008090_15620 [Arenicella chitinivorans]